MTSIRAFASIPFFQDAGEDINNLPERFAELGIDRSTASIKQAELAQLAMVASTYWDMVAVLENIEVQSHPLNSLNSCSKTIRLGYK